MIKVSDILSIDKRTTIGVSIKISGEEYFVSFDQKKFPGVRLGSHPRYFDMGAGEPKAYPEEIITQFQVNR